MIASLPMYWRSETAEAWRAMWRDVQAAGRRHGLDLPDLTPPEDIPQPWTDHWLRDDLVLSQTCSMPFRTALRDQVTYVGTFDFGLNCAPGHYYSRLIGYAANNTPRTLAINGYDSQSGYAVGCGDTYPENCATTADKIIQTGSHAASLAAVAAGNAEGAYLDAVTYRLCKAFEPQAQNVVLNGKTAPTPGLPLITAKGRDPEPLRKALRDACQNATWLGAQELGGLRGFVVLDEDAYLSLPIPPMPDALT